MQLSSTMSVPSSHPIRPREQLETLHRRALDAGLHYYSDVAVKRLIQAADSGDVTGVEAQVDGKPVRIVAQRGIVLASDGFARSKALVEKFVPDQADASSLGSKGIPATV